MLSNGGLKMKRNCCLEKVVSLILNGGLKKTTNQIMLMEYGSEYDSLVLSQLIGLQNVKHDCQSLILFPPVIDKVRR
jgi:hypothetical protein